MHEQGCVATVVENHVGAARLAAGIAEQEQLLGTPPVFLEALALPGVYRHARGRFDAAERANHDRRGGVVLRREDVAAHPAHVGAEFNERFDQHCGLDCHVQRTGDPGTLQWLRGAVLLTHGHQARHFVFGELDLFAAEIGKRKIGDFEIAGKISARGDGCGHGRSTPSESSNQFG